MSIRFDHSHSAIEKKSLDAYADRAFAVMERLGSGGIDFTGWVNLPRDCDRQELLRIEAAAEKIRKQSSLLIVIGIGGSYLGASAVAEALGKGSGKNGVRVIFAGNNLSALYHGEVLAELAENETSLCVISKSGTTTEPAAAFAVLKSALTAKYGEAEARGRIYVITDAEKGVLRQEAEACGYESFAVPSDIGGRYSVLSAVGLLPLAAAGVDIYALLEGAEAMRRRFFGQRGEPAGTELLAYGTARLYLHEVCGKQIEVFEYYEPRLRFFAEWLKQLFGESDGKEGKGLFPTSLSFSADLHSMGQLLQQGNQIFFETVLAVENAGADIELPAGSGFDGLTVNDLNRAAMEGVIAAHGEAGIPVFTVSVTELSEFCLGELIYFFEMNCAAGGMLMGIDPFDQPGVEAYKQEMKKAAEKMRRK